MSHNGKRDNGVAKKGEGIMSVKGDRTREVIRKKAYGLFAEKGYKAVTMKDICEATGLSRGGLYRHYESTEQIFLEIMDGFSNRQREEIESKIKRGISACGILEELLLRYKEEMVDCENSLSLAIYEFYSDPAVSKTDNSVVRQYEASKGAWRELIDYGISTKEFLSVDPEGIFHLVVFAYQGVRMYSRLMEMDERIPGQIVNEVKRLLIRRKKTV